jgi:hypothetical protein
MRQFYRKGYFMNIMEQDAEIFGMIKNHACQRERLAGLKNRVAKVVENFRRAATDLALSPELFNTNDLVPTVEICDLLADVRATIDELNRLSSLIHEAGHGNLIVV